MMSVVLMLQNFYYKNCRTITLNSKYIIIFKNPRSSSIIQHLGREMNNGKKNCLLDFAYQDATKGKSHSYVFIDLNQDQNDDFRIRSNVFPDSNCIVYMPK